MLHPGCHPLSSCCLAGNCCWLAGLSSWLVAESLPDWPESLLPLTSDLRLQTSHLTAHTSQLAPLTPHTSQLKPHTSHLRPQASSSPRFSQGPKSAVHLSNVYMLTCIRDTLSHMYVLPVSSNAAGNATKHLPKHSAFRRLRQPAPSASQNF